MTRQLSLFDMGVHSAETIARRMPVLWWGMVSPGTANHAEMAKMVIEKQMAFAEGVFALQMEVLKLAFRPWWEMTAAAHHEAAQGLLRAALQPSAKRVKANARRLRRR
jgi:hypothetical protein